MDLSNCKSAIYIGISLENISSVVLPKRGNNLKILDLYNLRIKTINLSNCNKVQCLYLNTTWYKGQTATMVYSISDNLRKKYQGCNIPNCWAYYNNYEEYKAGKKLKISKENFPSFYKILKNINYDHNQDGWLSGLEIATLKSLIINTPISDITGIEKLTSLKELTIVKYTGETLTIKNPTLDHLTLEPYGKKLMVNAPYVKNLYIGLISISPNGTMSNWHSGSTVTTNVDISKCKAAKYVSIEIGTISSLKLPTYGKNLVLLELDKLKIKNINLSSYTNLQYLRSYYCENLSKIDFSKNKKLTGLWFSQTENTKIRKLDLSNNKSLEELDTYGDNSIKVIFAKGADYNWSKLYNHGVHKIRDRVMAMYSLKGF